jgi:SPP1 family predicted phage head-tail adaptor
MWLLCTHARTLEESYLQATVQEIEEMIQAGQLRHPIKIQIPVETQDDLGQQSTEFQDLYDLDDKVRAEIVPLSGREYVAAKQVVAEVTTRMKIRFLPDVVPTCRILRPVQDDTHSPPETTEETRPSERAAVSHTDVCAAVRRGISPWQLKYSESIT